ncbi:sugar-binding protein [Halalkalibacter urbisdiaboli]|uniref:sugar-binding protein n=1 Tax=Halalkalibacter urbisdiaboli TaxID=1960589 RepID=UPI000B44BBA6|nr:sugar-binding protein [Halalkalibacter urbisdiaboli]
MRQNKIHILLIIGMCISFGFMYHYFVKALQYDVTIDHYSTDVKEGQHFVLIVEEKDNPYFTELLKGALDAARPHNITVEYIGPKQTNIEEHIKLIEKAIAAKVDGILTQGLSDEEFAPIIDKAISKGIPLITVDTDVKNSKRLAYVGTNNYQAGYKVGQAVLSETKGPIQVGIVSGSLVANQHKSRVKGFLDAVEHAVRVEVVAIETSNLSKIQGAEKTFQMLRTNPEINVLYGTSALDGVGISDAIEKINPAEPIIVYAFDDLEETIDYMNKGVIHSILRQQPYDMGYKGVNLLIDILDGKEVEPLNYTDTEFIRKDDSLTNITLKKN